MLEYLEPRKAKDENLDPLNEDTAVYLTSSWIIASAYSIGKNTKYHGHFETNRIDENLYIFFENDNLDDEKTGYKLAFFLILANETIDLSNNEKNYTDFYV